MFYLYKSTLNFGWIGLKLDGNVYLGMVFLLENQIIFALVQHLWWFNDATAKPPFSTADVQDPPTSSYKASEKYWSSGLETLWKVVHYNNRAISIYFKLFSMDLFPELYTLLELRSISAKFFNYWS